MKSYPQGTIAERCLNMCCDLVTRDSSVCAVCVTPYSNRTKTAGQYEIQRHSVPKMAPQTTCHCAHAPVGLLSFHLILGGDFSHQLVFCMLGTAWTINPSKIWKSLYGRQRQGRVGIAARV
jgi:hypothetical protein